MSTDRDAWAKHIEDRLPGDPPSLGQPAGVPRVHMGTQPVVSTPKPSKYRNQPQVVDGHQFPSKREANRYEVLKAMLARGEIFGLELQPKFPLHVVRPDGVKVEVGSYRGDFRYLTKWATVIEDAKGCRTESYQMRKRHVEAEYQIQIIEV